MNAVMEKKPKGKKPKAVGLIERLVTTEGDGRDCRVMARQRIEVYLGDLVRHPDNRTPSAASVDAVAESMRIEGQLEPILVRSIRTDAGEDRYQAISGETRWLAARSLGWKFLVADVVELDDAAALRVLAAANAARQDLDPIAKARLIVRLCEPIDQGGSDMSREDAARMFDLQSGGAASNLVRLLELPPTWLDRVASGDLAQSYARELLPLLLLGPDSAAWGDLEEQWQQYRTGTRQWDGECFRSREMLADEVFRCLEEHSRPIEKADKRTKSYYEETKSYENHSLRFKLTPTLEEELRIVDLPVGQNGAMIRRATNCKLYDSFQVPAIKAYLAKKSKGKDAKDDEPIPAARLSPKEQAAEEAARREKAAEVLAKRIESWRAAWLRELVAEAIVDERWADLCVRLIAWQQTQVAKISYGDRENLALDEWLGHHWLADNDPWRGVLRLKGHGDVQDLVAHWLRCPIRDGYAHPMPEGNVEDLVELMGIDLADKWLVMQLQAGGANPPPRYRQFFELHSSEQLDDLGGELGVGTIGASKKSGKVSAFLGAPKTLKLPKSLRSLRGKRGAR